LTHQQILTIIQTGYAFFFRYHLLTITAFGSTVNFSVLRKSYIYPKLLPKEVDRASEDEKRDFEFKAFGGDGMNGFW
jgi:hypothetical protein